MKLKWKSLLSAVYPTFFLLLTMLVSVLSLYGVNKLTKEKRIANEKGEAGKAVQLLLERNGIKIENSDSIQWTTVADTVGVQEKATIDGQPYLILSLKGNGYGGEIVLMTLYSDEGNLIDAQVVTHSETDGIGSLIASEGYMKKFVGFGAKKPIPSSKSKLSPEDADAVSGASISFGAVAGILQKGADFIKTEGGKDE